MFRKLLFSICIQQIFCSANEWNQMFNSFAKYETNRVKSDIDFVKSVYNSVNISINCRKSINQTLEALQNSELFAYQMYDSWPPFPPQAILEGTVTGFGDYDQCMAIKPNEVIGSSQYCAIKLKIPLPKSNTHHININHKVDEIVDLFYNKTPENFFSKLSENAVFFRIFPIRIGLCLPERCDRNDIQLMAEKAFRDSGLILQNIDCNTKPNKDWNAMQIIAVIIMVTFALISTYATLSSTRMSDRNRFVKCFSLKLNATRLLSTDSKPELSCIDGIRVLTMAYIIAVHTIELTDWELYRHSFKIKETMNGFENIPLTKGNTVVDTFFVISGVLSCYTTFKLTRNHKFQFDVLFYLVQRVIRILPLMSIFIFSTSLLTRLNSGPIWNQFFEERVGNCYTNWWTNLLFLNNFVQLDTMCVVTTWYIPVDMQIHVLSVIVILALLKRPNFGFAVISLIILVSSLTTAFFIATYDFSPGRVSTQFGEHYMQVFMKYIYWKPWTHAPVYFVGMFLGYLLHHTGPLKISKTIRRMMWCLIAIGFLVCIYDTHYWTLGAPNNRWVSAVTYPSTRIVWALTIAAVIWLCVSGNGSLVNRFLSWSAFTVLSRITYSVYLTHVWIVWVYWASVREPVSLYPSSMFAIICYTILFSYLFGFGFALLFECPINYFQIYLKKVIKNKTIL